MTHPLTPREKVELKPCPFCGGEVFADQEKSSFIIGCFRTKCGMEPYCTGDDLNEIANQWNRRTALASGSGDHAELARLAEAASGTEWQTYISGRPEYKNVTHYVEQSPPRDLPFIAEVQEERDAAFIAAANPGTVLALLAEIAALRAERRNIVSHATMGATDGEGLTLNDVSVEITRLRNAMHSSYHDRATEAERKLAEADRAARKIVGLQIPPGKDPEQRLKILSLLAKAQVLARSILSKEAERG